jgi:hypothetical protein
MRNDLISAQLQRFRQKMEASLTSLTNIERAAGDIAQAHDTALAAVKRHAVDVVALCTRADGRAAVADQLEYLESMRRLTDKARLQCRENLSKLSLDSSVMQVSYEHSAIGCVASCCAGVVVD